MCAVIGKNIAAQERVRYSRGKGAIGVRVIEVSVYKSQLL